MTTMPLDPLVVAEDAEDAASRVTIPHAEQALVFARPEGIGHLWVEDEYDELQEEQRHLWSASAEGAARSAGIEAAKLQGTATEAGALVSANRAVVDQARERMLRTSTVLSPFRRRARDTKAGTSLARRGCCVAMSLGSGPPRSGWASCR